MYINIPTNLCFHVLRMKLIRKFKLYLFLSTSCSGKRKITSEDLILIASKLGYETSRSIKNNLNSLIEMDWVGYNPKSKYYFIRGIEYIISKIPKHSKMRFEYNVKELNQLHPFMVAVVIEMLIRGQKRKMHESERKKGRSRQDSRIFYPIANAALAKVLNISINTAYRYKKEAGKLGYIDIKRGRIPLTISKNEHRPYVYANPHHKGRLRFYKGKWHVVTSDLVRTNIILKKGKKSKHIPRV